MTICIFSKQRCTLIVVLKVAIALTLLEACAIYCNLFIIVRKLQTMWLSIVILFHMKNLHAHAAVLMEERHAFNLLHDFRRKTT